MTESVKRRRTARRDATPVAGTRLADLELTIEALRRARASGARLDGHPALASLPRRLSAALNALRGDPGTRAELGAAAEEATRALEGVLDASMAQARAGLRAANEAELGSQGDVAALVAHARRLAFTTFAPPGFVPGVTPLGLFRPPAPAEAALRTSQLHGLAEERRKRKEARAEGEAAEAAAARAESEARARRETDEARARPAGGGEAAGEDGRGGDLDLAKILEQAPPMPAGWKPGDPIPGLTTAVEEPGEEGETDGGSDGDGGRPGDMGARVRPGAPRGEAGADGATARAGPPPDDAREDDEEPEPAVRRPALKAFDFVLNADFDPDALEFGADDDDDDDDDESEESEESQGSQGA